MGLIVGAPTMSRRAVKSNSILSPTHQDLVALWDIDNVSGSALVDSSLNDNDGTITGATVVGDALVFAGSGDYVRLPNGTEIALPITISLHVEFTSLAAFNFLWQSSDWVDEGSNITGAVIQILSTGAISASYGDGGTSAPSNRRTKQTAAGIVTTGVAYHIIVEIVGSGDMTITVDDVDKGGSYSGTGSGLSNSGAYDGKIGGITTDYLNAKLRKKNRVFSRALTIVEKTVLNNEE